MTQDLKTASWSDMAGEYALGLMEGQDRVEFEARLVDDAQLREEVARWQEHFAALGMQVEEVAPPASVFEHLKRELWSENALPWRRRIRIWEYALGGIAAALVAYVVYNTNDLTTQSGPILQAQIQAEPSGLHVAMAFSRETDLLRIEYSGPQPEAGRTYELWAIVDGNAPVSLGVLQHERISAFRLNTAQARLVRVGVTLALSDEPTGGSPTGAPTGAVLGVGAISVLTKL